MGYGKASRFAPLHFEQTLKELEFCEDLWEIYRADLPDDIDWEGLVLEGKGITTLIEFD